MKTLATLIAALLIATTLQAETLYVTDSFRVPMRTGSTNAYRIRAELKTGTAVELIETDAESGYSKVRTPKGTEGWVLSRYLTPKPIAKVRLARTESRLKKLTEQQKQLSGNQSALKETTERMQQDNNTLQELNTKLVDELTYIKEISGNTVAINERNQELVEENLQLQNKIELLTADNDRLKDDSNQSFFLYGAGTIVLGIILGLTIPSIRRKRKDPGWV